MKKAMAAVLAAFVLFALASCGGNGVKGKTFTGKDEDGYRMSISFGSSGKGQLTTWDDKGKKREQDSGAFTYKEDAESRTVTIEFPLDSEWTYEISYDEDSMRFSKEDGIPTLIDDDTVFYLQKD